MDTGRFYPSRWQDAAMAVELAHRHSTHRRIIGIALALLALVSCQSDGNRDGTTTRRTPLETPTGSGNDVIVLVGTSSGDNSWRGDGAFRGADLGVSYLNRTRSDGDPIVELVTLDDGGDVDEAIRLIQQEAAKEHTIGVVFAGPATALARAEAALAEAKIPAMLCFGDLYGAGLLSDHVFQMSPSYVWEADRIARYIIRDRRYETTGGLVRDSLSGRVARRALREAFRRLGRRAPVIEPYTDAEGIAEGLRRLKARRVEAIVLESSPSGGVATLSRLERMGATYSTTSAARIASASNRVRARVNARNWRPQVVGFDGLLTQLPGDLDVAEGTIAADTYARGVHYLPIPSLVGFREAYEDWWGERPLNWERRSYEAVRLIGWAARNTTDGDPVETLETLKGERFGGLDVAFGPRDHMAIDPSSVGLWVVPRRGAARESQRLPDGLPWVPLGRGFSRDGRRTSIPPRDWRWLFRTNRTAGLPPLVSQGRFGVTSGRSDPFH